MVNTFADDGETASAETRLHLDTLFGKRQGRAHVAIGRGPHRNATGKYSHHSWRERTFNWPAERDALVDAIFANAADGDVYLCPYLMHADKRHPGAAVARPILHADVDGDLDLTLVRQIGGFVVTSGQPGHGHVYVPLNESIPANAHRILEIGLRDALGADNKISANDLLRPVGSLNHKPAVADHPGEPGPVEFLIRPDGTTIDPATVALILGVTLPGNDTATDLAVPPLLTPAPPASADDAVDLKLFDSTARALVAVSNDRSADTARIVGACVNEGLTLAQTRWAVSTRPDLAARLATRRDDDVARLWDHFSTPTDGALAKVVDLNEHRKTTAAQSVTLTDTGNADLLVRKWGDRLRYCPDTGHWLRWTGMRWDETGEAAVFEAMRAVIDSIDGDAEAARHKIRSLSRRGIADGVALAMRREAMTARLVDLDARPYELNTPSGVVALKTGALTPHRPDGWHTKITGASVDLDAPAPRFEGFLARTFGGDTELIAYVQRLAGLAAIGRVTHHVLPFLFGGGSNGKSVLLDVLTSVLGDYAITAPANFLLAGREKHETEIARLHGARLVVCSEVNRDSTFDEAKVKTLTGGDRLTGRFMRQDYFDFVPSHTLFLMGNHQPEVEAGGTSFWRRLRLIPFLHTVPPHERVEGLADQLVATEGPAILAWIISGARQVAADGLREPSAVMAATAEYGDQEDALKRFLGDCVEQGCGPDIATPTPTMRYAYERWSRQNGEAMLKPVTFGRELSARFGIKSTAIHGIRQYLTVSVRNGWRPGDLP